MRETFQSPEEGPEHGEQAAMPYLQRDSTTSGIAAAKERNESRLMAIPGVKGVGIARNAIGDDALVVFLLDASVASRLPAEVDGYPVETVVTGEIDAYRVDAS